MGLAVWLGELNNKQLTQALPQVLWSMNSFSHHGLDGEVHITVLSKGAIVSIILQMTKLRQRKVTDLGSGRAGMQTRVHAFTPITNRPFALKHIQSQPIYTDHTM